MRLLSMCLMCLWAGAALLSGEAAETYVQAKARYEQESAAVQKRIAKAEKKGKDVDKLKDEWCWLMANQSLVAWDAFFGGEMRGNAQVLAEAKSLAEKCTELWTESSTFFLLTGSVTWKPVKSRFLSTGEVIAAEVIDRAELRKAIQLRNNYQRAVHLGPEKAISGQLAFNTEKKHFVNELSKSADVAVFFYFRSPREQTCEFTLTSFSPKDGFSEIFVNNEDAPGAAKKKRKIGKARKRKASKRKKIKTVLKAKVSLRKGLNLLVAYGKNANAMTFEFQAEIMGSDLLVFGP